MASTNTTTAPFIAGKKIIVAGGGIGGLAFATALSKQWASVDPSITPPTIIIYERDAENAGIEREGYSMSIRSDGVSAGMQTLRKLGILDSCLATSITGIQENPGSFVLWDQNWNEIMRAKVDKKAWSGLPVPHMRIARNELRGQLLQAVPESTTVRWGTACTGAAKLSNGKISVQLSNGKLDECDLLIAADGSGSKIRGCLRPDDKLNFAGAVQVIGNAVFPDSKVPSPVDRDWGLYLNETGTGCFLSPIDEYRAVWSISYRTAEPRKTLKHPLSSDQYQGIIKEVLERSKTFKEPIPTLINATDPLTIKELNAYDKQPFAHNASNMNVVFIGDSNHAVSPFAGNGANMAMMDAWDLAEQLCKNETFDEVVIAYDALSMPRARSVIEFSHRTIGLSHATGWTLWLYSFVLRIINWWGW
ncbi:Uncharacterized protein BP5553_05096 [Venustampulla echinocandica]|uniref:FAD-binding domain-containing protein n=1 Tax=Venustampulla echinocandica TaxID=2656787 RepID=A0A370TQ71_9HELO|nr:Uncharacterized protein BP5553_05096 [Venustampulla echinocandica]RDL37663.1 Uncharacterized protein BP5553_05096 [Venustampulla echinocandica]